MFPFERLTVWRRAHALAVRLHADAACWQDVDLRDQVRRCSNSVAANIAEGAGCDSQGQFARYLAFARASASELRCHLLYARDVGLLAAEAYATMDADAQEVRRMLFGLRRRVLQQKREGRSRPSEAPSPEQ